MPATARPAAPPETAAPSARPVQGAQSFARGIEVLQMVADAGAPVSRADLARRSPLARPTLYRLIASLEAEGLIEPAGDNRYRLGGRLVSLARAALAQNDVRAVAAPLLAELRDETGETVHLAVPSGDALVYIDKIESRETVRMASTIGARVPLHSSGVGKAWLSALPEPEAEAWLAQADLPTVTPFTTTAPDALRRIFAAARVEGVVRDDQENEVGIVCFGAPILGPDGRPRAAVSVSVPLFRLAEDARYAVPLRKATEAISRRLGWTPPR
ncbi:MAG: IclR family transcriptional regulator [Pseudomonadota bacterium]